MMSGVISNLQDSEFPLSDEEFERIRELSYRDFGLSIPDAKKQLIYSRLSKRLRCLGIESFGDYVEFIGSSSGVHEKKKMLSALTTNVTSFFREFHHFQYLRDSQFSNLRDLAASGSQVRIWCAGCSTGEEPFSIALCLLHDYPEISDLDVKILATDIDEMVLARARTAAYDRKNLKSIPLEIRNNSSLIQLIDENNFLIGENAVDLVSFAKLNLIDDWPMSGRFDVIFCRNVVIYFDKETQSLLWIRFLQHMKNTGVLMLGHSERLSGVAERKFVPVKGVPTAFQVSQD